MATDKARDYTEVTLKKLFGLSRNKCAHHDCNTELILPDGTVIAEICHIKDAKPGGRYSHNMSDDERRSFENLILLCRNCHKITDNVTLYSVDVLLEMKKKHEAQSLQQNFVPTNSQVERLMASFSYNFEYVEKIDWGILEDIVKYVLAKTPVIKYSDEDIENGENFLHTKEKVQLNFPSEQRVRFSEMFKNTTAKKLVIDSYLTNLYSQDSTKVDELNEFIISTYCEVKGVSTPNTKIDDIKYVEELAKRLIPEVKQKSPEYLAAAKALIINTFEYCHIGAKTTKEKQTSLFD